MSSWVEISVANLIQNYEAGFNLLTREMGTDANASLLAVVKANAYGHGLDICATALAKAGAGWLGVADVSEGIAVRRALTIAGHPLDPQPSILLLGGSEGIAQYAKEIVSYRLVPTVWDHSHLQVLAQAAEDSLIRHGL